MFKPVSLHLKPRFCRGLIKLMRGAILQKVVYCRLKFSFINLMRGVLLSKLFFHLLDFGLIKLMHGILLSKFFFHLPDFGLIKLMHDVLLSKFFVCLLDFGLPKCDIACIAHLLETGVGSGFLDVQEHVLLVAFVIFCLGLWTEKITHHPFLSLSLPLSHALAIIAIKFLEE